MSFQDKTLQCSDCSTTFTFSVEDQEFFQSKGYTNEPKRCPECRQARKAERYGNSSYGAPRQMFPATCAECGTYTDPRECKKYHNIIARIFGFVFRSDRAKCIDRIREVGLDQFASEMAGKKRPSMPR